MVTSKQLLVLDKNQTKPKQNQKYSQNHTLRKFWTNSDMFGIKKTCTQAREWNGDLETIIRAELKTDQNQKCSQNQSLRPFWANSDRFGIKMHVTKAG